MKQFCDVVSNYMNVLIVNLLNICIDVNGKVVHLVQRAPPSATRRARSPQPSGPSMRRPFGGFNGSANAMYLGSMAFPSGLMEAQGIVPPPPTQSLSGSRLNVARR